MPAPDTRCTAFQGWRQIASGLLRDVAVKAKALVDTADEPVLIFDDETSRQIEVDFRGSAQDVLERIEGPEEPARGPGRPKLGVVAREVTLLPRHWDWLNSQDGGASVTLRKLVDQARRQSEVGSRKRRAQDVAYRFMSAIGGDLPGLENASRALFAGDRAKFLERIAEWPLDVRNHVETLARPSFETE